MKIKILFMVLLLSPLCAAWGQSMVNDVPPIPSDTSIVRYWQQGVCIVYTHNKDNENWFLLVDSAMPQVRRIAVPENVTVNDFRILHNFVYVGGHYVDVDGIQHGMLACFDIQDFYNGAGVYHWMLAWKTQMPDCYWGMCKNQIYDVTRLAVYDDVQAGPQIAYIAKNYIVGETTLRVGIGWATYYMGSWQSYLIYNKHAIEEYTDIIATQNYVVAVARTNDSARLAMRIYPKGNFLVPSGLWPGIISYSNPYGQGLADLIVDSDVMATALNGDEFSVAYHYINSPKNGLAVKTFSIASGSGLALLQQGLNATVIHMPSSSWKMRDICYSPSQKKLMVLNDFDGGIVGSQASIIYQFQLPILSTGTYFGRYLLGYNLYAMDIFENVLDSYVASGHILGTSPLSLYWEKINVGATCGLQDVIMGEKTTAILYSTYMATNMNMPLLSNGDEPFSVEEVTRNIICIQK